jgi:hypothetical protein
MLSVVLSRNGLTVNIVWLGGRGVAKEEGLGKRLGGSNLDSLHG